MSEEFKPSAKDLNDAETLLKDIPQQTSAVLSTVQNLINQVKDGKFNLSKGFSFLNLKSHTLLNYLINMTYVILKKTSGKSIKDDPAIERLVELRTVLEKMRPIDQKLKYQMQKLITAANTGNINADDPLHFKANPENFMNQDSDDDSDANSDEEQDKKSEKPKVYVPPKIAASFYDEDKIQTKRENQRKNVLNRYIVEELRQQHDMGPEEIKEVGDYHRKRNEAINERIRYEEEYMIRLPVTKKQKHEARFSNSSALELTLGDMSSQRKRSSKRFSSKKLKGKIKSFKRRKH